MNGDAISVRLLETGFDPGRALGDFAAAHAEAGAVASFLGQTRKDADGVPVKELLLQCYPGFTEAAIEAICETALEKWPLSSVLVIHRYGEMAPGDPIVLVATAAEHRRAALAATEYLIDRLKTGAPFWKKEITDAGEKWIEPTGDDYARTAVSRSG
ncbi:MAG: molybdenum cofactor biosynthesis protein MoaE [Parvularculaceae bacterium]